eukprot:214997_1
MMVIQQYEGPIRLVVNCISLISITTVIIHSIRQIHNEKNIRKQPMIYSAMIMFITSAIIMSWRITTSHILPLYLTNYKCDMYYKGNIILFTIFKCSQYIFLTYRLQINCNQLLIPILSINCIHIKIMQILILFGSAIIAIFTIIDQKNIIYQIKVLLWGYQCIIKYPKYLIIIYSFFIYQSHYL